MILNIIDSKVEIFRYVTNGTSNAHFVRNNIAPIISAIIVILYNSFSLLSVLVDQ